MKYHSQHSSEICLVMLYTSEIFVKFPSNTEKALLASFITTLHINIFVGLWSDLMVAESSPSAPGSL